MDRAAPDPLQVIRGRIDEIDEQMHRLLIDRSAVIDELIRVKGTSKPGAAFRPDREADMMRRIVVRHAGNLPLITVEHIWREIITTFTAMQAPFGIAVAPCSDPLAMRDVVRFYFGFSIPVTNCASVDEAVARVAGPANELAVVAAGTGGRWWGGLSNGQGPKIFAKLPFIETENRPAALPAYVVGPPLKDPSTPDIQLIAAPASSRLETAVVSLGGRIAGRADGEMLIELPIAATLDDLAREGGLPASALQPCGGFAQPIQVLPPRA